MKLTVSVSFAQRVADAIHDLRHIFRQLERTHSNVWVSNDEGTADEVEELLYIVGIPEDEYTIE